MPSNTPNLALPYPITADTVDVPRDVKALADKLDGFGAWQTPSYTNSWIGEPTGPLRFRKRPDGVVEFQGQAKNGTVNQPVFTLPVGYRPLMFTAIPVSAAGSTTQSCQIDANGVVIAANVSAWFDAGSVRFPTV